MERKRVWDVVVREANTDYLPRGSRLPTPSTAVERKAFSIGPGGKGATQAVAAARLGTHVTLLAPQRGGGLGEPAVTERVVNTLLAEIHGLEELQGVVVIGATNRPTFGDARGGVEVPGARRQLVLVWVALRWASAVVRAIGAAGAQTRAKVFGLLLRLSG